MVGDSLVLHDVSFINGGRNMLFKSVSEVAYFPKPLKTTQFGICKLSCINIYNVCFSPVTIHARHI